MILMTKHPPPAGGTLFTKEGKTLKAMPQNANFSHREQFAKTDKIRR